MDSYRPAAQKLIAESQSSDFAWQRLAEVTDTFGQRLSGSDALERAIDWAVATMKKDGLENVRKEPVMVPKWVRGRESLDLLEPVAPAAADARPRQFRRHAGAPASRATSSCVKDFDELDRARRRRQRAHRAVQRAVHELRRHGRVPARRPVARGGARRRRPCCFDRSARPACARRIPAPRSTTDGAPKIPAAAITAEDADRFQRLQDRGVRIRVKLSMEAHFDPDSQSYNVVGELRGRELPERDRASSAATSTRGTSAPARATMAAAAS